MTQLTFQETLDRIGRDDALDAVTHYVAGACVVHERAVGTTYGNVWFCGVLNTVWRYLNGQQVLDGTCSDFECTLSHKAQRIFGLPKPRAFVSRNVPQLDDEAVRLLDDDDFHARVHEEMVGNRFVGAIKLIRQRFGVGLYEGKAMAEIMRSGKTDMTLNDLQLRFKAGLLRYDYLSREMARLWTHDNVKAALREGWILSVLDNDILQVQKSDELGSLYDDRQAWVIVCTGTGVHHSAARELVKRFNLVEWEAMRLQVVL